MELAGWKMDWNERICLKKQDERLKDNISVIKSNCEGKNKNQSIIIFKEDIIFKFMVSQC
jgi:hypothetical protein